MQKEKIRTIFNDVKFLRKSLEEYFIYCDENKEIPTKLGMLLYLQITESTILTWKQKRKNTFLQQIKWAHMKIDHLNLQRFLSSSPNASAWYLERAFVKKYHLSTKIDIKNNDKIAPITINLENKGKNKC